MDIFSAIKELDRDMIINQIANIELVTSKNTVMQTGSVGLQKTREIKNNILNFFGKKEYVTEIPEAVTIETKTQALSKELKSQTKHQLISRLKSSLKDRLNIKEEISDEELSIRVVNIASQVYDNIDPNLTQAEKIDKIKNKFQEELMDKLIETANDPTKAKELEDKLNMGLKNLNSQEKDSLKKQLNIDELNGNNIRKVLQTTGGASLLILIPTVSGFGSYIALTTIMHAIFTTALGITLPFAAYTTATTLMSIIAGPVGWGATILLGGTIFNSNAKKLTSKVLSQFVGISAFLYGKNFTVPDDQLAFTPDLAKDLQLQKELDELYRENKLLREKEEALQKKFEIVDKENRAKQTRIENLTMQIKINNDKKDDLEDEIVNLTTELNEQKLLKSSKLSKSENESQTRHIKFLQKQIEDREFEKKELEEYCFELLNERDEEKNLILKNNQQVTIDEQELKIQEKELENKSKPTRKKLVDKWTISFSRLEFDNNVYKQVIKSIDFKKELIYLERKLNEMEFCDNPKALDGNRGKMVQTGHEHIEFKASPSGRIFYTVLSVRHKDKYKIRITSIEKHNNSTYGSR